MLTLIKEYLCVICSKEKIVESIAEHTLEGDVPDISNCDFSTYSDHRVTNGRLLANRPKVDWKNSYVLSDKVLPGGICTNCLESNSAVWHLFRGGHINFVDEKNLKNSK